MMINTGILKSGKWKWTDLHKKFVQVLYYPGNPDTMEPVSLVFFDIENGIMYDTIDLDVNK